MKRYLVFLFGILLTISIGFAQGQGNGHGKGKGHGQVKNLSPEERATLMTLRMKSFLGFGAELEPKVKEVNLDIATRMKQTFESTTGQDRKTKMMALQTERDQKMKNILPADLYAKYMQKREQQRQRHENRKGGKGKAYGNPDVTPGMEPESDIF